MRPRFRHAGMRALAIATVVVASGGCWHARSQPAFDEMRIVRADEPVVVRALNRQDIEVARASDGSIVQAIPLMLSVDPDVHWSWLRVADTSTRVMWTGDTSLRAVRHFVVGRTRGQPATGCATVELFARSISRVDPGRLTDYDCLLQADWQAARDYERVFLARLDSSDVSASGVLLVCVAPSPARQPCYEDGRNYRLDLIVDSTLVPDSVRGRTPHLAQYPFHVERRNPLLSLAIGLTAIVLFLGGSVR